MDFFVSALDWVNSFRAGAQRVRQPEAPRVRFHRISWTAPSTGEPHVSIGLEGPDDVERLQTAKRLVFRKITRDMWTRDAITDAHGKFLWRTATWALDAKPDIVIFEPDGEWPEEHIRTFDPRQKTGDDWDVAR